MCLDRAAANPTLCLVNCLNEEHIRKIGCEAISLGGLSNKGDYNLVVCCSRQLKE